MITKSVQLQEYQSAQLGIKTSLSLVQSAKCALQFFEEGINLLNYSKIWVLIKHIW